MNIELSEGSDFLIGRVPIYDRSMELYAYDLPLQSFADNSDWALIYASKLVPFDDLTGSHIGFVRLPSNVFGELDRVVWPRDRLVLNISDEVLGDDQGESMVRAKVSEGFRFSLEAAGNRARAFKDSGIVSLFSLDASSIDESILASVADLQKKGCHFLARNIDTAYQFDLCNQHNIDYFQGRYFQEPRQITGGQIPANRVALLQLLARLQDPEIEIAEVESLISQDATLSSKLIRLLNSAYFGARKEVDSIKRSVVFFGLQRIKNWASVLSFNALDYQPRELLMIALVRARTCELLAEKLARSDTEAYYVAGLFSILDAIIDTPIAEILDYMHLSREINQALTDHSGPVGEILAMTLAFERAHLEKDAAALLPPGVAMATFLDAIKWANQVTQVIHENN